MRNSGKRVAKGTPNTARIRGVEPCCLLNDRRRRPERQDDRDAADPASRHAGKKKPGRLQRIGEIAGKTPVMLAQRDAIESELDDARGLAAQLRESCNRIQFVMEIEDHEDVAMLQRARSLYQSFTSQRYEVFDAGRVARISGDIKSEPQ